MSDDDKSVNVTVDLKEAGKALNTVVDCLVDFANLLGRPFSTELGQLFGDVGRHWRINNLMKTVSVTKRLAKKHNVGENWRSPPVLLKMIAEEASWIEDDKLQELWSGLLVSSFSPEGKDDSNLLFVNILKVLTRLQAKILDFACRESVKRHVSEGLVVADDLRLPLKTITDLCEGFTVHEIDIAIDGMRATSLVKEGISFEDHFLDPSKSVVSHVELTPTGLALNAYLRFSGSRLPPIDFYTITPGKPNIATNVMSM